MLSDVLHLIRPTIEALAAAWLARGAVSMSVWEGDQMLACWPKEANPAPGPFQSSVIQVGEQTVGTLRVTGAGEAQEQLENDSRVIASLVPLSKGLARMTSELIESRDQMVALYQITQSCRTCVHIEEAIHSLAQSLVRYGKAPSAFVALIAATGEIYSAQYPTALYDTPALMNFIESMGQEETRIVQDGDRCILLASMRILAVQQVVQHGVIGLVASGQEAFGSPDLKMARAVAAHAGAQLESLLRAQTEVMLARMQTEMELARRVQATLLPKTPPSLPGLRIWADTRPAYEVGGDFYDFVNRPGIPTTFVVGDISGKGFAAALLMSMTRTVIRSEARQHATPESILEGANLVLYDDLNRLSCFASIWAATYLPREGRLVMANAGHSPVLFQPAGQPPQLLIADGPPLGIFVHNQSRNQSLAVRPGDLLLVGSDGLTDVSNPSGERFGMERLMQVMARRAGCPPGEIAETIFQELEQFSDNSAQFDDQTLVIFQWT